ncbi:hypothetical protein LWM68_41075 [Niabella sp. W65]|nr:hypothetical protein [Niabella sp. W65]MCH7368567.1 hypothetical protein [Niabella sp. W65]ULT44156.1 hypothetical protein KRR40_12770 [Niabella sp. I65]
MEDVKGKIAIVYLPNGTQRMFTTSKNVSDSDSNYFLVDKIVSEPEMISIGYRDGKTIEGESFVRMPYILQMWK